MNSTTMVTEAGILGSGSEAPPDALLGTRRTLPEEGLSVALHGRTLAPAAPWGGESKILRFSPSAATGFRNRLPPALNRGSPEVDSASCANQARKLPKIAIDNQ